MVHIVFNEADTTVLQQAIALDDSLRGDVWQVKDDYAVGPLAGIYTTEGISARKQWWKEVLAGGDYDGKADTGEIDDNKLIADLVEQLTNDETEKVWIWAAQNKHDVSGYYWLMSQLKDYQSRIFILYLNNLPFINEKGMIFYPTSLFQIQPKEFVKAKKLARPITPSEFEVDPDEWTKLANEDKGVRLLEGGKKLVQRDYDYYDNELLKFVSKDWQKVNKLFQQYYSKVKDTTGDAYLLWRLKMMIDAGKIDLQGNLKSMKEMEVKLKAEESIEVVAAN